MVMVVDGCASPKHPVFKVSCGQPPPMSDSALVVDIPRHMGPPETEGHSLIRELEAWQLFGETSPERVLGVPLKDMVDVLCVEVRGNIGPSCDKWL